MTIQRKHHRKSKNGCANCKRRRIKCDEAKPTCVRCTKTGLQCKYLDPNDKSQRCRKPATVSTTYIISPPLAQTVESPALPTAIPSLDLTSGQSPPSMSKSSVLDTEPPQSLPSCPVTPVVNVPVPFLTNAPSQRQAYPNLASAGTSLPSPPMFLTPPSAPLPISGLQLKPYSGTSCFQPDTTMSVVGAVTVAVNGSGSILGTCNTLSPSENIRSTPAMNISNVLIGYKDYYDDMNQKKERLVKLKFLNQLPDLQDSISRLYFIDLDESTRHWVNAILFVMLYHFPIVSLTFGLPSEALLSLSKYHYESALKCHQPSTSSAYVAHVLQAVYIVSDPSRKMATKNFLRNFKAIGELHKFRREAIEAEFDAVYHPEDMPPSEKNCFNIPSNLEDLITGQADENPLTAEEVGALLKFAKNLKRGATLPTGLLVSFLVHLLEDVDDTFISLIHRNEPKSLILMGYAIYLGSASFPSDLFCKEFIYKDELEFIIFKLGKAKSTHWKLWLSPILPP